VLKGVIFDLDGTLLDSEPSWKKADYLLATKYNFPLTDEFREKITGMGIKENSKLFIETYKLDLSAEQVTKERSDLMYEQLFKNLKLMPFALELLEKLKKQGFALAIATGGHNSETTKKILSDLLIIEYFPTVVSGLEVKNSKPAPDIFLETAKRMALHPNKCLVDEDAYNGVLAAKAAGMKVIGVNKEQSMKDKLKENRADFIFPDLNIPLKIFS